MKIRVPLGEVAKDKMESKWSGSSDNAYYNGELFDQNRKLQAAEYEYDIQAKNSEAYYVMSVDVGRKADMSEIQVAKILPQPQGQSIKHLIYLETLEQVHFEEQSIRIKQVAATFKVRRVVIDCNGPGLGLVDYLIKPQIVPATGERLMGFGVYNDPDGFYKRYYTAETIKDMLYLMKATLEINTLAHSNLLAQMSSGKIKFLIDERTAKIKLLESKVGRKMSQEERANYLKPYTQTSILKEQILNLREKNEGVNIILERANRAIPKDKFSSLEYLLYYVKTEEDDKRRRKKRDFKNFIFMN